MNRIEHREEMPVISSPSNPQEMDHHHIVALEVEVPQTLHQIGTGNFYPI